MNSTVDNLRQKLAEEYWLSKLAKAPVSPTDTKPASGMHTAQARVEASWLEGVQSLAKGNVIAEYTLYVSVYRFLLSKYFQEAASLIASPDLKVSQLASRPDRLLFYALDFSPENTFKEILQIAQGEIQTALQHHQYNYIDLVIALRNKGIDENGPLQFGFCYTPANEPSRWMDEVGFQLIISKDSDAFLQLTIRFDETKYETGLVQQFLRHFSRLVAQLKSNLATKASEIDYLAEAEFHQLLHTFNTRPQGGMNATIVETFEEQVRCFPDRVALVFEGKTWTYQALNQQANQLAHFFREEYEIGPESMVGIMIDRSEWIIISILGILKAGAAFVPIDPHNPRERIGYIIGDARLSAIVIQSQYLFDLEGFDGHLFAVDIQADDLSTSTENPVRLSSSQNLAYVIYTSGTTGNPKGVMVENGSVVNYAGWFKNAFGVTERDSSVLLASYAFDLGYTSIWGTLLAGGSLHLLSLDYAQAPDKLLAYVAAQGISFIKTTPSLFYILTHIPAFQMVRLPLRLVLLGGEHLRPDDVATFLEHYPETRFVNHYGPTEATIGTIVNAIDPKALGSDGRHSLIGKSIANSEVLILDEASRLVPVGVEGELCIGGAGLARGYLHKEALTAARFIPHPYRKGERLYRTGDYGKWTPDGMVVLLGRKDDQVKIRGYRVELGEVKNGLLQHPTVEDAAVLVGNHAGDQQMVAYLVTKGTLNTSELRTFLGGFLPEYMIPNHFVSLHHFPLTANGKLDYKALATMQREAVRSGNEYLSPGNEVESYLVEVWQEILDSDRIGINDNFFDLGGHSLLLVKMNARLKSRYPKVSITDLFAYTTIAQLANFILKEEGQADIEIADALIVLPEEYFIDNGEEEEAVFDFQFRLDASLLKEMNAVAAEAGVTVTNYDILLAMFMYALGQLTEQDEIAAQVLNPDGRVNVLRIAFSEIEDVVGLYQQVREKQGNEEAVTYHITELNQVRFAGERAHAIVPFVYRKETLPAAGQALDLFDMLLEIDEKPGAIQVILEYNRFRLRHEKMETLFQLYLSVLQSLTRADQAP